MRDNHLKKIEECLAEREREAIEWANRDRLDQIEIVRGPWGWKAVLKGE